MTAERVPLSRARVLGAAVAIADRDGIAALTMRRLAQDLGVEAMSLYHHVANKEALLDGVIEVVMAEIAEAVGEPVVEDWQAAMRARVLTARQVFLRHPWAARVLETRTSISPGVIAYYDGVLAIFRAGGFSYDLAHRALHALGSRALGFSQELFDLSDPAADAEAEAMVQELAEHFPHLAAMVAEIAHDDPDSALGWCDHQAEFEFGLDLILSGLERLRAEG
ncbi:MULTISPECIES: TetR/AcrR family transcriptional regulator C-terminal domain-containing protein [Actinokineospora]|uniref:TetR family transcriptional regulator n=1 Tax=Actinokineospora fastidiosa TaxID=1816 RepID=A0A918LFE1_9PSEU|nr:MULTISPECIES: TetR/AcrR family transcriptional regulator C-terminal domain-containing protein [Actinokineospora]UVS81050.1 Tetracycline repressor protein class B from transposon Tn10 [Actinokineospora sp. UTMC 2448]GGS39164.1 TetR family transcriptional regulator [Actinokineospora fastidiosa]